jgi:type IV pilus biogenesis protein PilP
MKVDKKQLIGGAVAVVALLGVSVATGKLDINKLTGKTTEAVVERKLPPPIEPEHEVIPGGVDAPADDVLASVAGEGTSDAFVSELVGEPTSPAPAVESAPVEVPSAASVPSAAAAPIDAPVAQLASTDASAVIAANAAFKPAQVLGVGEAPAAPVLPNNVPGGFPATSTGAPPPNSNVSPNAPSAAPVASTTPGAVAAIAPPPAPAAAGGTPSIATPVAPTPVFNGGSTFNTAAIATLPTNATGKDLLELQTQLAVLEKQKAIASGQEAIAESLLKRAKAQYEMAQIGQPTAEQRAAIAAAQAAAQAHTVASAAPTVVSALNAIRLLSTSRTNGAVSATLSLNGKLIDVKKGSLVAGYLVDKVSDNSVQLVGEGESKTVWID